MHTPSVPFAFPMTFILPPRDLGQDYGEPPGFTARAGAGKPRAPAKTLRDFAGWGAARLLRATPGRQVATILGLSAYAHASSDAKANLKRYVNEVMAQAGDGDGDGDGDDRRAFLPSRAVNPAMFYRDAAWRSVGEALQARGDTSEVATRFNSMLAKTLELTLPQYGKHLTPGEYRRQYAEAFSRAHPEDAPLFTRAIKRHCLRAARARTPAQIAREMAAAGAVGQNRPMAPAAVKAACHVVTEVCCLTAVALLC